MSKGKLLLFKLREFPHLSETFIVAQMVTAIKLGYDVKILVNKILTNDVDLRSNLIVDYGLLDKVIIEDYGIPKNKIVRFFKWILLLVLNAKELNGILKFYKEHSGFSLTWLYQWAFYRRFKDVALVHVQYGTNKNPVDILKKTGNFKPPLIVTFHGHDAFFPINGRIPEKGYYDGLFANGDLITANTPYLANKILELKCPESLIAVVPVAVDTRFFYPPAKKKVFNSTLRLITVGRLDKVKGHTYSVEIVNLLIKKGIAVSLTIIGEGPERKTLENLIASYKLEENVFLLGKKSQSDVRQAYWEHDIYLLMAIALTDGRRETQGLATLEAQACGLPAVVFDSGGVKYTIANGVSGFVCAEYDINAAVEKIEVLAKDRKLIDKMGANATIFVNKTYSQKMIDEQWNAIYKTLTNESQ